MGMIFLKVFVLAHFATEADDFFSLSTCTDMGGSLLEFELFLPLCHRQAGYYSQKLCPCRVLCCSGFWLGGQDLVSLCQFLWSLVAQLICWVWGKWRFMTIFLVHSSMWKGSLNIVRCSLIVSKLHPPQSGCKIGGGALENCSLINIPKDKP